ncbi:MAG: YdcF family protein [Hyphomicrobium sp.]|jgi:uncharacterized SAM-binding protein YcdF (DUF218 family)
MIIGVGATVSLLALGFVLFASVVTRLPADNNPHADGIVVLTGEGRRIAEGARLLDEGRAQRMLISGVFRRTGKKALLDISGLPEDKFDCCVDVGYAALDTAGNANETRAWATSRGYDSLIVVTASYHMPRSLAELSLALPATRLVPHPVMPNNFPPTRWWLHASATRTLISEYFKFLPTAAHLTVAKLFRSSQQSSVAEGPAGDSAGIF